MINSKTIEIDKASIQTILEQQRDIFEYVKKSKTI